jgi:hypothetical protein
MHLHTHLRKSLFGKAVLAAAALGGFLFFAGAPKAQAADRDDCERRIARNEYRLHEAVEDHGYYSRQANHWRHELNEAYERCDRYRYRDNRYRGYDRDDDRCQRRYDRDWNRDRH